jgi:hypothetical protein
MMLALLLALTIVPAAGGDKAKNAPIQFSATKGQVFAAAMVAVAKDAVRLDQVNQEAGFISYVARYAPFGSFMGGPDFPVSITLISEDEGKATRMLVVCEKSEVKKKAILAIADELLRQKLIPQSEVPGSH